jgi:hypothetical protein
VFFHQVLRALLELAKHNIKMFPVDEAVPVPAQIRECPGKMWPYFEDCIGAIDGTLIYASVKNEDRDRDGEDGAFRCRKGFLAKNVSGCVDFDMNFRLVYGEWEGTALMPRYSILLVNEDCSFRLLASTGWLTRAIRRAMVTEVSSGTVYQNEISSCGMEEGESATAE